MESEQKKQNQDANFIITQLEIFIEPFEAYVRTINERDADVLKNDFYGGKDDDWDNEKGPYSVKMRNLVKKYFPSVKVGMIAWSVPQCCGGVIFFLEGDQEARDDVLQKVKMDPDDYKIGTQEDAMDMINSVTF